MRWIMAALGAIIITGAAAAWPRGGRHAAPPAHSGAGRGVLVPYSNNPGAPTVVVVHGITLFPRFQRNTLAQDAARAAAQQGANVNVMGYDWNDVTRPGLRPRVLINNARHHGDRLAAAIQQSGVDPSQVHIVGHSLGTVVAAQAARNLANSGSRPAELSLLDVPKRWHSVVYGQIQAGSAAGQVENVWAPGLTGLGKPCNTPGVANHRSPTAPGIGTSNHSHCASSFCNNLPNGTRGNGAPSGSPWAPNSVPAGRDASPANSAYAFNGRVQPYNVPAMPASTTMPNAGFAYGAPAQPVAAPSPPVVTYVYGPNGQLVPAYPSIQPAIAGYPTGVPVMPAYPAANFAVAPPATYGPAVMPAATVPAIPASLNGPASFVPASMSRPR